MSSRSTSRARVTTMWSATQVIQFIELYRGHECLWNVNCTDYTNRLKRDMAYKKLMEYGKTISGSFARSDVINKINNLRSNYRKEVKKVELSKASALCPEEIHKPRLFYFDDLDQFLGDNKTFFKSRENAKHPSEQDVKHTVSINPEPFEDSLDHSELGSDGSINLDLGSDPEESPEPERKPEVLPQKHVPRASSKDFRKRKRKVSEDEDFEVSYNAPNCTVTGHDVSSAALRSTSTRDKYDIFGEHIASNLREMTKEQQIRCMKIVSDSLFEGLLGNLSADSHLQVFRPAPVSLYQHPRPPSTNTACTINGNGNTDLSGVELA
ncbi:hypothetical protein EGW08_001931 [Elysia chlorotica]|uniref:MADF domain-containing protein n=1 Tax=Elysia chlorotica TaxID=188477 RepID=A0A433U937_ELYCH|nr:hypothetical protein EGW08_001931 [Elysia chlorotica]